MARTYRLVDRDQEFLLAPSMVDWLPEDHLVWFVIAVVDRLDTTAFHGRAKLGGVGRRGYDPDMLLTLFVYAMAHGQSSSRRIERLCHTDVAFRIVCASDVPDHTVLARFRQDHEQALTDLLTESLVLAAEVGMLRLGVVAFDGTKIAANASRDANRGEAHLRRLAEQFVSTVAETDAAEDAEFGQDRRGDEVPEPVADRTRRRERIDTALEVIAARRQAAEQADAQRAGRAHDYQRAAEAAVAEQAPAPKGRPPADADPVAVAKARWERQRAKAATRYAEFQARPRPPGRRVDPDEHGRVRAARAAYEAAMARAATQTEHTSTNGTAHGQASTPDEFRANLTDPESRLLKTRNGWIQGYNCQTAISDDEFLVCARATQDTNDLEQFVPTKDDVLATAAHLARRTGRDDLKVGVMIGDAGYDSTANLDAAGPDRLIADAKARTMNQRAATDPATGDPPDDATEREKMNHRLRTDEGITLYRRRGAMIEAPNAWLKDRRGLSRFARRGLAAAQAELAFAAAVTNLLKLNTKGITTAQLRTT